MTTHDIVIAGGGVSGLFFALRLAQACHRATGIVRKPDMRTPHGPGGL
jgi:2-polyprenyl-6-methoxyphenol hydroxylase-like FAD-dependent oxidoreductase